jgi:site-specific DNA recombinase
MAKSKAGGGGTSLIPAVGYLRRSDDTDSQAESIPEQRAAVEQYAADKGYRIVRWYEDDAISGDNTRKRRGFLQMVEDARRLGDFRAILCWDRARFGRFDSIEYGYYVFPLREAGVVLVTVTDGLTDWSDVAGRLVATVLQEGKHQQLIDHSANVARGQLAAMEAGGWVGSPAYGYRLEGPKKAKRLVLGEPAHVKVVRRIFDEYARQGRSTNAIAARLNADGIPSPRAKVGGWHPDTVKGILANPAYAGDFAAGRHTYGKYHVIEDGKVTRTKKLSRGRKDAAQWVVRPDHHEAIIDRPTWETARAILARGKTGRSPYQPGENPYVLSGKLRCGLCGGPMQGKTNGGARYYECSRRAHDLKRVPNEVKRDPAKLKGWLKELCEGTTVKEHEVLNSLADFLEDYLGLDSEAVGAAAYYGGLTAEDADSLPEAFWKVKALFTAPAGPKRDRKRLEARKKELAAKVAKGRANLVFLDPDNIPAAQASIREHEAELAEVEQELRESKPPAEADLNATALAVLDNLYQLAYCCRALARPDDGWDYHGSLEMKAPAVVGRFLGQTAHIACHTTKTGAGVRRRHTFAGGEILVSVGAITGRVNPHTRFKRPGCCR